MDLSNIVITLIHQSSLTLEAHATKINKLIESYKDLSKEKDSLVETAKSELADLQTKRKQITELSELLRLVQFNNKNKSTHSFHFPVTLLSLVLI